MLIFINNSNEPVRFNRHEHIVLENVRTGEQSLFPSCIDLDSFYGEGWKLCKICNNCGQAYSNGECCDPWERP